MLRKYFQIKILIIASVFVLNFGCSDNHLIKSDKYRAAITDMYIKQLELSKGRDEQLFSVFSTNLSIEERESLEFLYAFMPLSDLADYDGKFFLDQMRVTIKVKQEMIWCKTIPEDIFLHFVLPLRVNNENLDSFRVVMYDTLKSRIRGLSMRDAALEINHWCHERVTYRGTDSRTSAPLATMKTSWGRCGEESTLAVCALRTVGIPARQVYTPRWAHTDDNHAWVEVWIDGKWCFMGACEPEPDLNMGWFAEPARRAMLIHTRAYGHYLGNEPILEPQTRFGELNLIANYTDVKPVKVRVINDSNYPVDSAKVEYRLYNYAEFYPIAKTFTNNKGYTGITAGLGDMVIWASKDKAFGYKKVSVGKNDLITIQVSVNHPSFFMEDLDIIPPVKLKPKEINEKGKIENKRRLVREDSIRNKYMSTFKDSLWSLNFADDNVMNLDSIRMIFRKSQGNWEEIADFMKETPRRWKMWILPMLNSLTDKDLRDCGAFVLEDHMAASFVTHNDLSVLNPSLFSKYVLSPRISNEFIRPWRTFLQSKFDYEFVSRARKNRKTIVNWILGNIRIDNIANFHSRSPLSPKGVYELKVADSHSRDIFFVAVCRSLGFPARLNPVTSLPEYFEDKEWKVVYFEQPEEKTVKGFIHFINGNKKIDPKYSINFTLSRFSNGSYILQDHQEEKSLSTFPNKLEVDAGKYLLVTGKRLSDGSVLSSMTFFEVKENSTTDLIVAVREPKEKLEAFANIDLTKFSTEDFLSKQIKPIKELVRDNGGIFILIDPDKEPSRHVMTDIPLFKDNIENWGGSVTILISKENMSSSFKPGDFSNLPKQATFAIDTENKFLNEISKIKEKPLKNNLPVIVLSDKEGNLLYFSEGYTIGIGENITRAIELLKKGTIDLSGAKYVR
jgi:hypothetical protein